MAARPPPATLFPYTTLFRSEPDPALTRCWRLHAARLVPQPRFETKPGRGARASIAAPSNGDGESGDFLEHLTQAFLDGLGGIGRDRKSTRLNSSHQIISYAV